MATPGLDSYGARSNHGSAPYEESAWKAILRRAAMGLGPGLQGLSAVRPGSNFGDAFLSSLGASSKATSAAQQAAQEYAMKVQQAQDEKDFREIQKAEIMARTEQLKKPPTPDKPSAYVPQTFEDVVKLEEAKAKIAARYRPPKEGAATPKEKPPTAGEKKDLGFYNIANASNSTAEKLEDKIARMPLIQQFRMRKAPNALQTSDMQVYNQAKRAFIESKLRQVSGAAISQGEYESYDNIYFAQPGDSKAVRDNKRALRKQVLSDLKNSAGKAAGGTSTAADLRYNPETGELEEVR